MAERFCGASVMGSGVWEGRGGGGGGAGGTGPRRGGGGGGVGRAGGDGAERPDGAGGAGRGRRGAVGRVAVPLLSWSPSGESYGRADRSGGGACWRYGGVCEMGCATRVAGEGRGCGDGLRRWGGWEGAALGETRWHPAFGGGGRERGGEGRATGKSRARGQRLAQAGARASCAAYLCAPYRRVARAAGGWGAEGVAPARARDGRGVPSARVRAVGWADGGGRMQGGGADMTVEVAIAETPVEDVIARRSSLISDADRWKIFLFGGGLLLLINFSSPAGGLIDIPVSFFLKNRLHLQSNELAVFKLWIGTPLFLSFLFGFLRDRWSPFGLGDRGHLMVFGLATGLIYAAISLLNPTLCGAAGRPVRRHGGLPDRRQRRGRPDLDHRPATGHGRTDERGVQHRRGLCPTSILVSGSAACSAMRSSTATRSPRPASSSWARPA